MYTNLVMYHTTYTSFIQIPWAVHFYHCFKKVIFVPLDMRLCLLYFKRHITLSNGGICMSKQCSAFRLYKKQGISLSAERFSRSQGFYSTELLKGPKFVTYQQKSYSRLVISVTISAFYCIVWNILTLVRLEVLTAEIFILTLNCASLCWSLK